MFSADEARKRKWPFLDDDGENYLNTLPSVPEEVQDEEICFGSIIDVKTQLCNTQAIPNISPFTWDQSFSLIQEGDFFSLANRNEKFARLNKKISSGLCSVVQINKVRLRAYTSAKEFQKTVEIWKYDAGGNSNKPLTVEINVYGPQEVAEKVGNILGKAQNFLQLPRYGLEGKKYRNPQILPIGCFADDSNFNSQDIFDSEEENQVPEEESPASQDDELLDVQGILLQHVLTTNISVDRRIQTSLLTHQKEAVDFIARRENGEMPPSKACGDIMTQTRTSHCNYQHILNGEKRPRPEHARGGIVADEMGLGKSLVILSIVAGSLGKAREFAAAEADVFQQQKRANSQATLILAPSTLLIDNWVNEIRKHAYTGSLTFHKHIGLERHSERDLLCKRDIVFTTYATLATEFCRGESILSKVNWFRIVLDEAHYIRNRATKQFQAVTSLSSQHRWCLTGTPIQNDIEDLGALIAFLKVPVLDRASTFRKLISHPINSGARNRFKNLQTLLHAVCIRRTRELIGIPDPDPQVKKLSMSQSERVQYRDLLQDCKMKIDMAVSGKRKGKLNSTVLESLLALRLFCNNGKMASKMPVDLDEVFSLLQQSGEDFCVYCDRKVHGISSRNDEAGIDEATMLPDCGHLVCQGCLAEHLQKGRCHGCKEYNTGPRSYDAVRHAANHQATGEHGHHVPRESYPTKLLALLNDIIQSRPQNCIVFSSWRKTLSIVAGLLTSNGISFAMIDGSLPLSKRKAALKTYESPNDTNVLLMTLGTGAVGLNLVSASCIYLLEPQWNPSIEAQAIGRALRLGQASQVKIVRYLMQGTVEESNVLSRQRTKLQLAGGGFQKRNHAGSESLQSLLDLFGTEPVGEDIVPSEHEMDIDET
ncbi:hypothetical protein N7532_009170 [Penicillium argentinense]|uniref:Uncharacterized protein n=1 Tax=Penicillium argentinense TaxID=1131581 RepID=A0A9W9EZ21_9EURO|nr:uncharacterized protein N7532_009170 [Penicillium argentinense]KAJ5090486.1 hypothetical protein N7532_009170 [Penicillium argentinense]